MYSDAAAARIVALSDSIPEGNAACAGQMKDILTTGLGMFIFGDVEFEPKNVIGVGIGLTGGIMYAYFSYRDAQKKVPVRTHFTAAFAPSGADCILHPE